MDEQRRQSRADGGARPGRHARLREQAAALAGGAGFNTEFKGYETTSRRDDRRRARSDENGRVLVKLLESPFYATGGGQVADAGYIECEDGDCLAARRRRAQARRRPGPRGRRPSAARSRRRARARPRRPRRPPRHRVQPHRHPPAACRAARAPRRPRASGRLLRRPRQAALRLHAQCGGERRGAAPTSRTRSTTGSSAPTRCARSRPRSTRPGRSARWRCSARSTATSCGWSRSVTAASRASCAAAPTCASTAEIGLLHDLERDLQRRQRAADRGRHRSGRGGHHARRTGTL